MMTLVIGLVVFFSVHLISTNRELRGGLVTRFGAVGYKLGYSAISLIGFALIIYGYHKMQLPQYLGSKNPILWYPPAWTRSVAMVAMVPAMILLVAAYVPSKIRSVVGHPMLAAIKIWALAHLMANGTAADVLLFGGFLVYAVYARVSMKRRADGGVRGDAPAGFIGDVVVVGAGVALFAMMVVWGHGYLIGKPLGM